MLMALHALAGGGLFRVNRDDEPRGARSRDTGYPELLQTGGTYRGARWSTTSIRTISSVERGVPMTIL